MSLIVSRNIGGYLAAVPSELNGLIDHYLPTELTPVAKYDAIAEIAHDNLVYTRRHIKSQNSDLFQNIIVNINTWEKHHVLAGRTDNDQSTNFTGMPLKCGLRQVTVVDGLVTINGRVYILPCSVKVAHVWRDKVVYNYDGIMYVNKLPQ